MPDFRHILLPVAFGLMAGCASSDSDEASETMTPTVQTQQPTEAVTPSGQQPAASATVRLNPEHGMPGHRCDIEVGAPLPADDGTAGKGGTTSSIVQPSLPTAPPPGALNLQPSTTAPGMNPPHGEPGHRCDIPVGAPLNAQAIPPQ